MKKLFLGVALGALLTACAPDVSQTDTAAPAATPARSAVEELHFRTLVLDTHLDTPAYFHDPKYTFSKRGDFDVDGTHVDLPRMNEGGLDGGFWVIFTAQGPLDEASYLAARNLAVLRQMSIREMAAKYSDHVELAFSTADAERIAAAGKKIVFQSMENAYPLGTDISMLDTFYVGGLRMIAPVHFRNS